jgi:CubicO group peptidase (beta-lactamase class C family)
VAKHIPSTRTSGVSPREDDGSRRAAVTDAMHQILRTSGAPGASVAVVSSDRPLFSAGYGLADVGNRRTATPSTAYLWFSMTKVVTATAAMRLADEGRLDLDAPVHVYVPDLPMRSGRQPSTRQLLTHTAGLSNPFPVRWVHPADRPAPSSRELLVRLLHRRRAFRSAPGTRASYTNVGYLLAGEVIAAAAGMPLEAYVQQEVLDPAGMHRTGYAYRPDQDAATGYVKAPRVLDPVLDRMLPRGVPAGRYGNLRALHPFYVDGPAYGGLVGDVEDAARFLRLHLNDGELDGRRVLSRAAAREMRRIAHPGRPFDHGIGWFRKPTTGAQEWVEHFGAGAGFWNAMRLYPDRNRGVVVMANTTASYDIDALCRAVVDLG